MIVSAIADYLEQRGIDPAHLGARAGMPPGHLESLLRGEGEMSIDEYLQVCAALGLDYQHFFPRVTDEAPV